MRYPFALFSKEAAMVSMIRPIHPVIPNIVQHPDWPTIVELICLSALAAFCLGGFAAEKFEGNKSKTVWLFVGIAALVTVALFCFFGFAATTIKGIILSLVLAFCSYSDIKTRECDDYPYLMIVIAAFIGTELTALPGMILSGLTVGLMMYAAMFLMKAVVNGADLKLAAACAFLLGFWNGIAGLIAGLLVAVIVNLIKLKNKKDGFPLIPYLAIGFMMAYFI